MKKTILIVAVLGVAFYYFKNIYGWIEFRPNTDTPKQFLNKVVNIKKGYTQDSSLIISELKKLLLQKEDFFNSSTYFEGTEIIVDTIVYSADLNRLGILIYVKNPAFRELMPDKNAEYYYDATTYLGARQNDSFSLSRLGPNFTNSTDPAELSAIMREQNFRLMVSRDTSQKFALKYNLDDTRFWTSSIWQKIENDKIKRKEFEEMKLKHPENVYEPPKAGDNRSGNKPDN